MLIDPNLIVATARTYIGTPHRHAQRVKGVGIDCAGLLICVCNECGIPVEDYTNYSGSNELELLISHVLKYSEQLPKDTPIAPADILVFKGFRIQNHAAFATGTGRIIHSWNTTKVEMVVENGLSEGWLRSLYGHYRLKDVIWPQ